MLSHRINVQKLATCKRCGSNKVAWMQNKDQKWYLVNVSEETTEEITSNRNIEVDGTYILDKRVGAFNAVYVTRARFYTQKNWFHVCKREA